MRDRSASYWFTVGDKVRVVADNVEKAGVNLQNRVGRVVQTWEKCDVDPTCCCAEQVDLNMAVRVEFNGTEADPNAADGTSFLHYFGEIELIQVKEEEESQEQQQGRGEATTVAFTCNQWHLFPSFIVSASRRQSLFSQNHADDAGRDTSLPFDGMSCSAFKMDHLQSASQTKRGIFSYEPPPIRESPLQQETTEPVEEASTDESLPFDGMSCTAFKMNHLQRSATQKPRGIFSYADALNDL